MYVSGEPLSSSLHPPSSSWGPGDSSSWGPGAWKQNSTRPGRGEYSRGRAGRTTNRGRPGGRNGQSRQIPPRFANAAAKNTRHEKKSGDFEEDQVLNMASNEIYDDVFEQQTANDSVFDHEIPVSKDVSRRSTDNKPPSSKGNQEMHAASFGNSDDKKSSRFKNSDEKKSSRLSGSDEKKSSNFQDNDDKQATNFRSNDEKKLSNIRGSDEKKSSRKSSSSVTPPIPPLMEIQTHNPNLTFSASSSRSNSSASSSPESRSSSGSNYSSSGVKSFSRRKTREFVVSRRSSKSFSSKSKEGSHDWKSVKTDKRGNRKLKETEIVAEASEDGEAVEAEDASAGQIGEWVEVTSRSSYKKGSRPKSRATSSSNYVKEPKTSPQDKLSPRESTPTFNAPDENGDIGDWAEEIECKKPAQWISPEDLRPGWVERPVQKDLVTWMREAWQKTLKELEVGKLDWDPKVMYFSKEKLQK